MRKKIKINSQVLKEYEKFVAEISEIGGIAFHSNSIIENYAKSLNKAKLKELNIIFLGGMHFAYRSPYDRNTFIFGKSYLWDIKNYNKRAEAIKLKTNNYFVAIGYEFFESFLRSLAARIIVANPSITNYDEKLGFRSYSSCLIYLKTNHKYKDTMNIIRLFRDICPELEAAIKSHQGLKNYLHFFEIYIKCRNHIIHTNGYISGSSYLKFSDTNRIFAENWFGVKKDGSKTKYIIDTSRNSDQILKTLVELGLLIVSSFDKSILKRIITK